MQGRHGFHTSGPADDAHPPHRRRRSPPASRLRFDPRLPRHWYHRYQAAYMWAAFPLLQLAFQVGWGQGAEG